MRLEITYKGLSRRPYPSYSLELWGADLACISGSIRIETSYRGLRLLTSHDWATRTNGEPSMPLMQARQTSHHSWERLMGRAIAYNSTNTSETADEENHLIYYYDPAFKILNTVSLIFFSNPYLPLRRFLFLLTLINLVIWICAVMLLRVLEISERLRNGLHVQLYLAEVLDDYVSPQQVAMNPSHSNSSCKRCFLRDFLLTPHASRSALMSKYGVLSRRVSCAPWLVMFLYLFLYLSTNSTVLHWQPKPRCSTEDMWGIIFVSLLVATAKLTVLVYVYLLGFSGIYFFLLSYSILVQVQSWLVSSQN